MTETGIPDIPYSQEAEEAVIGAVLISPTAFVNLVAFLQPNDFFLLRHKYIWQAMSQLHERRDVIDVITLSQELQELGTLEDIGGNAYLAQLLSLTPSSVHAESYGRIVERTSIRRRLLVATDEIRSLALNEEMPIDNVVQESESRLFMVTERKTKREFVSMNEAVNEYFDQIEHLINSDTQRLGVPSGYRDLDALLGGFQRSDLLIFAGRPGMGKSSFMLSTGVNIARFGARVAIFTMEMGVDQLVQRMISMETGISTQKLRLGDLSQHEYNRFVEAAGRVSRYPIFVDDTPALNPNQMRTKCRRLQHEHGLDIIFVDYLQLMNAGGNYQNNRVQEVSYISRHLKELARELNVPIFSAAQLSRAVEQRQDKRPVLSDLRESGSLEQDADIVMFLYRDAIYNEATEFPNQADVIVAKHRNGPTGTISLYFEQSLTKFIDGVTRSVDLGE
jgi:replicative DNA helicase